MWPVIPVDDSGPIPLCGLGKRSLVLEVHLEEAVEKVVNDRSKNLVRSVGCLSVSDVPDIEEPGAVKQTRQLGYTPRVQHLVQRLSFRHATILHMPIQRKATLASKSV